MPTKYFFKKTDYPQFISLKILRTHNKFLENSRKYKVPTNFSFENERKSTDFEYLRHLGIFFRNGAKVGLGCGEEGVGDHEEVGVAIGGVGTQDELVYGERCFGFGLWGRWSPMDGERWPFERVRDDEVVEERGVLLPHGVLFLKESRVLVLVLRHGCGCGRLFELLCLFCFFLLSRQNVVSVREWKVVRVRSMVY